MASSVSCCAMRQWRSCSCRRSCRQRIGPPPRSGAGPAHVRTPCAIARDIADASVDVTGFLQASRRRQAMNCCNRVAGITKDSLSMRHGRARHRSAQGETTRRPDEPLSSQTRWGNAKSDVPVVGRAYGQHYRHTLRERRTRQTGVLPRTGSASAKERAIGYIPVDATEATTACVRKKSALLLAYLRTQRRRPRASTTR
jgi:hypothetical protein